MNGNQKIIKSALPSNLPEEIRAFLFGLYKYSNAPFLVCDINGKILLANPLFTSKLEYSAEELIEQNIQIILQHAVKDINDLFSSFVNDGDGIVRKKITLANKHGNKHHCNFDIKTIKYNRSRIFLLNFGNFAICKKNKALTNELEILHFLSGLTGQAVWSLDENKNLFYTTKQGFELLGLEIDTGSIDYNSVKKQIYSLEQRNLLEKQIKEITSGRKNKILNLELKVHATKNHDSKYRIITLLGGIRYHHKKAFLTGIIEDISNLKKYQKELKYQKLKAENADKYKIAFLKNLSYEIRTPMNTILGFSELLNQKNLPEEKVQEYTNLIRNKGNYLHKLIDDVIEMSKFESGQVKFNMSMFNLHSMLEIIFQEFETLRKQKKKDKITFILSVPEINEKLEIYSDKERIHQVLSNMVSNALQYTEKGKIELGYNLSDKYIKFYVSDTGIGMTEQDQEKIFNRFETMEDTAMKKFSGSGLNLTISRQIVEFLGGKIKVKSNLNEGSVFQIYIPLKNKKPIEINESKSTQDTINEVNWKNRVILIAEDEEVNYRFLEALIHRTQAKVLRAKNGQEAIDLCNNISQIDLVLMDIKMPVINGYNATISIKKNRPMLPIIAQTAFADHEEIIKCKNIGCNDFVSKPIDIKILFAKIEKQFNI